MHPHIAVGDGEGEVMAVLAGLGIAQLPTWLVQCHLNSGRLVEVLPDLATEGLPMNLVWFEVARRCQKSARWSPTWEPISRLPGVLSGLE